MALFSKTDDEKVMRQQARDQKRVDKDAAAFSETPVGQARMAFNMGYRFFQTQFEVRHQTGATLAMAGAFTASKDNDPTALLNAIADEGWDLVTASFVFVTTGEASRDKFASSGQNIAISGSTVGYYVFRRSEQHQTRDTAETSPHLGSPANIDR